MIPDANEINGIIFDLDGTLYRRRWYMNPLLAVQLFPSVLRLSRFLKIRGSFSGKDLQTGKDLTDAICNQLSPVEKKTESELENWIEKRFYPAFVNTMYFFRNSRPELNEVLAQLHKKGYKLAVLSDYDQIPERLEMLTVKKSLFDTMTSSEHAGALKPSPRPFLEIASTWNLKSHQVLVIGDRDDTDGEAARKAGMPFLHLDDKIKTDSHNRMNWPGVKSILEQLP